MPSSDSGDPDLLARVLGTAPPSGIDVAASVEVLAIAAALRGIAVPPAQLPGWQALCADEYADAVRRLQHALGRAIGALAVAARSVQ